MMIGYCYASGEIEFCGSHKDVPAGAIAFADNVTTRPDLADAAFAALVKTRARRSKDGRSFLVPGIPEAGDQVEAGAALKRWVDWTFKKPSGPQREAA